MIRPDLSPRDTTSLESRQHSVESATVTKRLQPSPPTSPHRHFRKKFRRMSGAGSSSGKYKPSHSYINCSKKICIVSFEGFTCGLPYINRLRVKNPSSTKYLHFYGAHVKNFVWFQLTFSLFLSLIN